MTYRTEIAIDINRRVRMTYTNFWYNLEVSFVRGRWTKVNRATRNRDLAEKFFVSECEYINRTYPNQI